MRNRVEIPRDFTKSDVSSRFHKKWRFPSLKIDCYIEGKSSGGSRIVWGFSLSDCWGATRFYFSLFDLTGRYRFYSVANADGFRTDCVLLAWLEIGHRCVTISIPPIDWVTCSVSCASPALRAGKYPKVRARCLRCGILLSQFYQ